MKSTRLQLLVTLVGISVAAGIFTAKGLPPSRSLADGLLEFDTRGIRGHLRWGLVLETKGRELSALNVAVIARDEARIRELVKRGERLDIQSCPYGFSPLHCAVVMGWEDGVRLLLDLGADVSGCDPGGRRPLWFAKRFERKAMADILRQHGAKE